MKIDSLKQKIKVNIIIAFLMITSLVTVIFFYNYFDRNFQEEKVKLGDEISSIESKISEIEAKSQENKKYKEIWKLVTSNKKSNKGIKNDDIEKIRTNLSQKYFINDSKIKMNIPENLPQSVFQNETLDILYTEAELTFNAYSDVKAILFAEEFYNSLHGYVIVKNFEIKKDKKYENKDLKDISLGKNQGHIIGKLEFAWYVFKEKAIAGDKSGQEGDQPPTKNETPLNQLNKINNDV
jgi:hypothetical protein